MHIICLKYNILPISDRINWLMCAKFQVCIVYADYSADCQTCQADPSQYSQSKSQSYHSEHPLTLVSPLSTVPQLQPVHPVHNVKVENQTSKHGRYQGPGPSCNISIPESEDKEDQTSHQNPKSCCYKPEPHMPPRSRVSHHFQLTTTQPSSQDGTVQDTNSTSRQALAA